MRDHFSKYSCAYPQKPKESTKVAATLMMSIGLLKILQCDNANGFKGKVLLIVEYHRISQHKH